MWLLKAKKEERNRGNIWINNNWDFSKINDRSTHIGSSENTKQYKCQKEKKHLGISYSNCRKPNTEKILKKVENKNTLPREEHRWSPQGVLLYMPVWVLPEAWLNGKAISHIHGSVKIQQAFLLK